MRSRTPPGLVLVDGAPVMVVLPSLGSSLAFLCIMPAANHKLYCEVVDCSLPLVLMKGCSQATVMQGITAA